jgi:hypothetical protein
LNPSRSNTHPPRKEVGVVPIADDLDPDGLLPASAALHYLEVHLASLFEGAEALADYLGVVDKEFPILALDEAVILLFGEPLDLAARHDTPSPSPRWQSGNVEIRLPGAELSSARQPSTRRLAERRR